MSLSPSNSKKSPYTSKKSPYTSKKSHNLSSDKDDILKDLNAKRHNIGLLLIDAIKEKIQACEACKLCDKSIKMYELRTSLAKIDAEISKHKLTNKTNHISGGSKKRSMKLVRKTKYIKKRSYRYKMKCKTKKYN